MRLVWLAFFFATTVVFAQEDFAKQLGEDVYYVPHVEVNFKSSTLNVVHGVRTENGGCRFPSQLRIDDSNPLKEGEKLVRVRRAINPTECIELVEEGTVEGDITD